MATYEIFKFDFRKAGPGQLFSKENGRSALEDAQRIFGEILREPLIIRKEKRGKEVAHLDNYVERCDGDILSMVVCNEKDISYREHKEELTLTTHPGCRVIIDNRQGVGQMAIERDASFNGNPSMVRDLLQDALNKRLTEYRLEVSIRAKKRSSEFWEMVAEQISTHHDEPTKVSFTFPKQETAPVDASPGVSAYLVAARAMCSAVNATKGMLQMESDKGKVLHLERTQEDFANMVALCSQNSYDISVHFKHYGVYRFGKAVKALFELQDSIVNDFARGQRTCEGGLKEWLDNIRQRIEGYGDEESTEKKRKRGHKE